VSVCVYTCVCAYVCVWAGANRRIQNGAFEFVPDKVYDSVGNE